MTDYDILQYLGLEIRDDKVIFYDDCSNENIFGLGEIKDVLLENAYTTVSKKIIFWFEKIFVQRRFMGVLDSKTYTEDYRKVYELEIELSDGRVLSRKVRNADIMECKEFIDELVGLSTSYNSLH